MCRCVLERIRASLFCEVTQQSIGNSSHRPTPLHEAAVARHRLRSYGGIPVRAAGKGRAQAGVAGGDLVQQSVVIQAVVGLLASPQLPENHPKGEHIHLQLLEQ